MLEKSLQQSISKEQMQEVMENGSLEQQIKNVLKQMMNSAEEFQEGQKLIEGEQHNEMNYQDGPISQIQQEIKPKVLEDTSPENKNTQKGSPNLDELAQSLAEQLQESTSLDEVKEHLSISPDKIPDVLKSGLRQLLNRLPLQEKAKIKQKAQEVLEQMEDEMLKKLQSELNKESNLSTHDEVLKKKSTKRL